MELIVVLAIIMIFTGASAASLSGFDHKQVTKAASLFDEQLGILRTYATTRAGTWELELTEEDGQYVTRLRVDGMDISRTEIGSTSKVALKQPLPGSRFCVNREDGAFLENETYFCGDVIFQGGGGEKTVKMIKETGAHYVE